MMMKNTAQTLIKLFTIALFACLIYSCSQKIEEKKLQNKQLQITKKVKAKKTVTTKKLVPLSDKNLKKELTAYGKANKETLVLLKTPVGNMKIKLYENTPLHRANFIRLIKNNFYKETMFYRVVNNFMIQGGDNDDWSRISIKNKMGNYTLPAELPKSNIHKKGALSMAREYENNPEKRSVSFEWFIVQGTKYTEGELLGAEKEYGLKIPAEHKEIYKSIGGTPHLDGQHTVFGQVVEGFDVIDKIAAQKVDEGNWPIQDITIEFQILN